MIPLTHCISSPQKVGFTTNPVLLAQELAAGGALLGSHEALTMYRFKETAQLPGFCWLSGSEKTSVWVSMKELSIKKLEQRSAMKSWNLGTGQDLPWPTHIFGGCDSHPENHLNPSYIRVVFISFHGFSSPAVAGLGDQRHRLGTEAAAACGGVRSLVGFMVS